MVPSLQELIDFLLGEVALCGNQGATISTILQAIETFYQNASRNADANQTRQNVDRRFKAKVWTWLAHHPDVSIGQENEWQGLSLDDAEKLDREDRKIGNLNPQETETDKAENESPSVTTSAAPMRIFVPEERTWHAIAGHGPDETKLPHSEFVLLSIIAAHRSAGIDQVKLVKLSGQDKRSVPKRTDSLQKKGYIQKRAVQVKSARTSLCTHKRFLNTTPGSSGDQNSQIATQDKSMVDFEAFVTRFFEILKNEGIVSRTDLKKLLGFEDRWRWKILSRAIRKFEKMGVVERVKAESQYEKLHPCVVLRREPTAKDIASFHEFNGGTLGTAVDDQADEDEEMELDTVQKPSSAYDGDVEMSTEKHVVDSGPAMPLWTPDRHLTNQLFDIIDNSGTRGLTNLDVNRICFGSFFRKPSESLLHRLTDCWQLSQPLHLRHLALLRDQDIQKTILFYRNFSRRNFAERVKSGETSWEAVEFSAGGKKKKNAKIPGAEATIQLDEYGFPQAAPPGLLRNGSASLYEGVEYRRPKSYRLTNHDPLVIELPNGQYTIKIGYVKGEAGGTGTPVSVNPLGRPKGSLNKRDSVRRSTVPEEVPYEEGHDVRPEVEDTPEPPSNRPKISKFKQTKLSGLARRERFEAMGMDDTWTEYNALLIDKPLPGVYITPEGKRRPAGKRQGRPRRSRIAVFKSAKLFDLPWFVKDQADSDHEYGTPIKRTPAMPEELGRHQPSEQSQQTPIPDPQASRKRPPSPAHIGSPTTTSKRKKQLAAGETEAITESRVSPESDPAIAVSESPAPKTDSSLMHTDLTTKHSLNTKDAQTSPNKRQRISSPERDSSTNIHPSLTPASPSVAKGQSMGEPSDAATKMVKFEPGSKAPTKEVAQQPKPALGGSINLLRRKIVMDIVEKAGGAYPSGYEIWYPFVTEWMNLKRFKEKPDVRTVKTAIKHLVDVGKLRQHTFSGRDSSGVMVTKTIITKPEMSPDDPLIKEMQAKVLATDRAHPKVSYSPNIVLDPSVAKHSTRATGQKSKLRVEAGKQVRLQSKPASVRNLERRRDRQVERALYKRMMEALESESSEEDSDLEILDIPGVSRLMQIQRPPALEEYAHRSLKQTVIFRPKKISASAVTQRPKGYRAVLPRHIMPKISNLRPYALLMSAQQTYHSSTGTFGTQSILDRTQGIPPRQTATILDPLHKLSQLANASRDCLDFHRATDRIARFEVRYEELFDNVQPGDQYISQTVRDSFQGAPIEGDIRFEMEEPHLEPQLLRRQMKARRRSERVPTERRLETVDTSAPARARNYPHALRQGKRRVFQPIPDSLLRKIMLAIVAVRVLSGGTEARHVDWDLVAACFPGHDALALIDRARNVLSRNRLQIAKMQNDFQERFLEAYANNEVPVIDYADLDNYAWPTLIEWANFQLEVSTSERAPSLPATREQFDDVFEIREEPISNADEIFTTTVGMTFNYRRGVMAQTPFAVMLDSDKEAKPDTPRQEELKREEATKSYVRANIVTPEDTYEPVKASTILGRFGEKRINAAVEALVRDRVIGLSNRGRVVPGRNYDITDHLLQQINRRRLIDCSIVKDAAKFKASTLDPKLKDEASVEIKYNAEDGHILAAINLFANGRVHLFPRGAPRDKFGLVDDGYLTRQMDKTKLRFPVDIRPTESYVYGNPVQERAKSITFPALSPQEGNLLQKIPLWMDLNGHIVEPLREMGIASVLGCLVLREGLSAKGISSMIKPAMSPWEIEAMLAWLGEVGVVDGTQVGSEKRWKVKEWWWLVLS